MENRTIKCPFDFALDQEVPLMIVFDTMSVGKDAAIKIGKLVYWIMENKNKQAVNEVFNLLRDNLGDENLKLFREMYLLKYDRKHKKVLRFHPVESEETIKNLFYIFNKINELTPALNNIAVRYAEPQ